MSCITEILKIKDNKEFILSGTIAIEGGGTYKGYEYLITFVEYGHRCGYVAISHDHPVYNYSSEYPDLEVHGGITFFEKARFDDLTGGHKCTDKWLGFDAGHAYDARDIYHIHKYFPDGKYFNYLKEKNRLEKMLPGNEFLKFMQEMEDSLYSNQAVIKDFTYMENECMRLIDQLIEIRDKNNDPTGLQENS